jgi:integrase
MPKLTKRTVDGMKAGKTQRFAWCGELPGFGIRITPNGVRAFVYQYRATGQSRSKRMTIGRYGELTVDQARDIATRHAQSVRRGESPGDRAEGVTFADAVDMYGDRYLSQRSKSHRRETLRVLRSYLGPKLNGRAFAQVGRGDVFTVVDKLIVQGKPAMGRSVYRATYGLFSWAVERQLIETHPLAGAKPPDVSDSRERALSDDEIARLWPALADMGYPFGPWAQLALLTGQRVNEVAGIRRSEIEGSVWTLPASRSKNRKENVIFLSDPACAIIEQIDNDNDLLFTTNGETQISGFSKARSRIDKLINLPHWTWHDLRRSFATGLGDLSVEPHVIEACLGHISGHRAGVAGVYNRAQYREQKERAFTLWAAHIQQLAGGDGARIVPLRNG